MKKLIALAALFISLASYAQFGQGSQRLHIGVGVGSPYAYSGSSTTIPPVHVSYEHGISDKIGVGGLIGYTSSKYEESFFGTEYSWKFSYLLIGARGSYHFYQTDKLDTYVGAMLAYNVASAKFESNNSALESFVTEPAVGGVTFGGYLGARYNFNDKVAGFAEVGYNIAWLSVGVCLNLN